MQDVTGNLIATTSKIMQETFKVPVKILFEILSRFFQHSHQIGKLLSPRKIDLCDFHHPSKTVIKYKLKLKVSKKEPELELRAS